MAFEPKKLAPLRILEILEKNSDYEHPMTQEQIASHLEKEYGIEMERKAIGRNVNLLVDGGFDICKATRGVYIASRDFENSELRALIDSVISSRYIPANDAKALCEKLKKMSNKYFDSHVTHIHTIDDWNHMTDNKSLFLNIELIDEAITKGQQIYYDFSMYDKKLKLVKTSSHIVSPYQMIIHNQRYYLMGLNHFHKNTMAYHRIDHISNIKIRDEAAIPLRSLPEYKNGINYKVFSSAMPYMFADPPQRVEIKVDVDAIDQVVDWFGKESLRVVEIPGEPSKVKIILYVGPTAMAYWALQYIQRVEVLAPESLRERIKEFIAIGVDKYN